MTLDHRMSDLKVGLPNLFDDCIEHAMNAVENKKLHSFDMSYYLRFLDIYFAEKGDISQSGYGLLPEDPEEFLNERLEGFKRFWSQNNSEYEHYKDMDDAFINLFDDDVKKIILQQDDPKEIIRLNAVIRALYA